MASRFEGLPAAVDAAIAALTGLPGRPVSRLHTETAIDQLPGITELVAEAVALAEANTHDPDISAIIPRLRVAAETARQAVDRFETHLRERLLPESEGDGRLGPELYASHLRHTIRDPDATPDFVLERAEREAAAVRAEMTRLATELWPTLMAGRERPLDDDRLVRQVLDAIADAHPAGGELLDVSRRELAGVETFVRERGLIGLPDEPLDIRWTPKFLQGFGGASLWSPGPLDRGLTAYFLITPLPDDWSAEDQESWLRELNDRQMQLLVIHEAVPGHYLQGVYANRCESLARTVFWSGVFAEGWAVYVTQIMIDAGFGADDPALRLSHWKFFLRSALNAVLDVRIHTQDLPVDEAIRLLVDTGFQEETEARNKVKRARLTSTQLATYFLGSAGLWDLEREARERAAVSAGAGRDVIPERSLPGGYGETPGFDDRTHLERVISFGAPPLPVLRRLVFGDEQSD
jgi:uncharacterized protein (DUF885 family)